jgi:protein-tyrosine phosphatase
MNFIKNLFSGKGHEQRFPPVTDYSGVITDIHSHLIPGIDDGVKSDEECAEMLRAFVSLGYKKVITTPHIMHDHYRNTPEIILEGLEKIKAIAAKENIPIAIDAAGEYYLDEGFLQKLSAGNILTIAGKYLLFEISYMNPPDNLPQALFEIGIAGYTPLLAHPERYPFWYPKFDEYRNLKDQGVLFQVNLGSIAGYYGAGPKKIAGQLIDEDLVDFIGSDLHGDRHFQAMKLALNEKQLWKLLAKGVKNSGL